MKTILFIVLAFISSIGVRENLIKLISNAHSIDEYKSVMDIIEKENLKNYIPLGLPLKEKYRISSQFGYRTDPINKTKQFHSGIDFSAEVAAIIYAVADGEIIFSGQNGGYGKLIEIEHKFGYKTRYGHLVEFYKKKGDYVKKGTPIGFVGSTGRSTGNHLHYEIIKNNRKINPIKYIYL